MLDDRELWKRIAEGDAGAFENWYRQTAPHLRAFLRRYIGSADSTDDLMQDVYTQIWRRPVGFDPGRGTLRTWLFGIARKQAAEWWRGQRPTCSLDEGGTAQDRKSGQPASDMRFFLSEALNQITADERSILWLREVEGQSYAELAEILDIPIGTVRSRLFAARQSLREVWRSAPSTKRGPS